MDTYITLQALARIKSLLKSKGLTYADFADSLGVSEVTVKRMLNNSDISLQRLIQMANILGVSIFEELAELEKAPISSHIFSAKQDEYFAKYPQLLTYFSYLTLLQKTPAQIQQDFQLSGASTHQYLRTLESIGLIRYNSLNNINILVEPPMGFGVESKVVKQQISASLNYTNEKVLNQKTPDEDCYLSVKPLKLNKALRLRFIQEYSELLKSYAKISERNYLSDDPLFVTSIAIHPADNGVMPEVIEWCSEDIV